MWPQRGAKGYQPSAQTAVVAAAFDTPDERASVSASRPHRCAIQSSTGDATKIDENVPTMMPNVITSANGLITSPAKNDSTSAVASVVPPVRIVRGNVSLIDRFRS